VKTLRVSQRGFDVKSLFVATVVAALAMVSMGCHCCAKKSGCSTCGSSPYGNEFLGPAPEWGSTAPLTPDSTFAPPQ
jgi:hypothetical protein